MVLDLIELPTNEELLEFASVSLVLAHFVHGLLPGSLVLSSKLRTVRLLQLLGYHCTYFLFLTHVRR